MVISRRLLFFNNFALKEVEEEGPVGTCLMAAVVLAVGEATVHQTVVHV